MEDFEKLLGIYKDPDDYNTHIVDEHADEASPKVLRVASPDPHPASRNWWPAWPHKNQLKNSSPPASNCNSSPTQLEQPLIRHPATLIDPPVPLPLAPAPWLPQIPSSNSLSQPEIKEQYCSTPFSSSSSGGSTTEDLSIALPHLAGLMLSSPSVQSNMQLPSPSPPHSVPPPPPLLPVASPSGLAIDTQGQPCGSLSNQVTNQLTTPLHLTDDYFQSAQITSFPNRSSQQDTADEWGWAEPISLPLLLPPPGSRTDDGGGTATHREESWPAADAVHLSGMHENEDGDLTNEEKISLLSIEFPSFTEQELQAALDGSNGKLDQAIALLNSFQEEDAGYGSRHQGSQPTQTAIENHAEFNALIDEMSAIKAEFAPSQLDQPAQFYDLGDVYETPTDEITTQLEELSMKFPSIPRESLMVALELTSFDLDAAQKILDEQTGGVSEEPLPEQLSQPISQLSTSISTNTPSKDRIHAVVAAARRQAPPKLPDHVRNQQIYDEERSKAGRLRTAYLQLDSQARHAAERGDNQMATDLNRRANELRQEYYKASKGCAARIAMRINRGRGQLGFMQVDLHALHIDEALEQVEHGINHLPLINPGGVVVRYITGRGAHSDAGAKLKPAVIALLEDRGVHFAEGKGYVDTIIDGKLLNQ